MLAAVRLEGGVGAMAGIGTGGLGSWGSLGRLPRGSRASAKTKESGRGRWRIIKTRGEPLISFMGQVISCPND